MSRLVLDDVHKARREAEGEAPVVVLAGVEYTLPVSLPASAHVALGEMQQGRLVALKDLLQALFGDDRDEVLAAGLEVEDFQPIFEELYGMDLGEQPASGG